MLETRFSRKSFFNVFFFTRVADMPVLIPWRSNIFFWVFFFDRRNHHVPVQCLQRRFAGFEWDTGLLHLHGARDGSSQTGWTQSWWLHHQEYSAEYNKSKLWIRGWLWTRFGCAPVAGDDHWIRWVYLLCSGSIWWCGGWEWDRCDCVRWCRRRWTVTWRFHFFWDNDHVESM